MACILRLTYNHWLAGMSLALHCLWGGQQPAWPSWVAPSSAVPVPTKTGGVSSTTGNRSPPRPGSTCKKTPPNKQTNKQTKINSKQTQRPEGICDRAPSHLTMIISMFLLSDFSLYIHPTTHGMSTQHPHLTQVCTVYTHTVCWVIFVLETFLNYVLQKNGRKKKLFVKLHWNTIYYTISSLKKVFVAFCIQGIDLVNIFKSTSSILNGSFSMDAVYK